MILSILIPTIKKREMFFNDLMANLLEQIGNSDVEILVDKSETDSIGTKRNELLRGASGEYVCFFDDDDLPGKDYISTLLEAIEINPDCVSLRGIMTTNGSNPEIFEHSLKYKSWRTTNNKIKYERYPNHLNCIRADIAKQFKFPEINHGEDYDWSKRLHESGLLKTEYYTDKILYYYRYLSNK
jgi:glycosyltransferase involved in cell wall biosynthesis